MIENLCQIETVSRKQSWPFKSISVGRFAAAFCARLISLLKTVIPACFKRESRQNRNWTPDKNIRGGAFGKFASRPSDAPQLDTGQFSLFGGQPRTPNGP